MQSAFRAIEDDCAQVEPSGLQTLRNFLHFSSWQVEGKSQVRAKARIFVSEKVCSRIDW